MKLLTSAQMKEMDRRAIEERGIPSTLLMDRAARGLLDAVLELAEDRPARSGKTLYLPEASGEVVTPEGSFPWRRNEAGGGKRAAVFAGAGNNGGDGIALARLLRAEGWQVRVFLAGSRKKLTPDSREMERRLAEAGGVLEDFLPGDGEQEAFVLGCDVLVDALFGVGLNAPLREPAASAVRLMGRSGLPVVAADIPSGIEADTGRVLGEAVKAAVTVTFSYAKPGLFVGKGAIHAGRVIVHDIGIPAELLPEDGPQTWAVTGGMVRGWLPDRPADGHKGDFGKVFILAGSILYSGAPVLAARAAGRSGAGLVFLDVAEDAHAIVASKCLETIVRPLPLPRREGVLSMEVLGETLDHIRPCNAALIGPGILEDADTMDLVYSLLEQTELPMVLDAGGLNLLARHMYVVDMRAAPLVLTPHDGEFARLGGDLSHGDRLGEARKFAREHNCILVLKGHRTIVAHPDGRAAVNTTGNSGMAKGGSGDVLAGMITALLAGGMEPFEASAAAVYLHGLAGDLCAAELGEWSMLPGDMIERLPQAFQTVLK